jgi:hypothetical protein
MWRFRRSLLYREAGIHTLWFDENSAYILYTLCKTLGNVFLSYGDLEVLYVKTVDCPAGIVTRFVLLYWL